MEKKWYQSKTIWINAGIAAAGAVAAQVPGFPSDIIPKDASHVAIVGALTNIFLRVLTKTKLV